MKDVLFLAPVFQKRLWGGSTLQSWFPSYNLSDQIGECWSISAHQHGVSIIQNGAFAGYNLSELYKTQPFLFGHPHERHFPLLVKILDAQDNLSVQVHPNDAYAQAAVGELGKTECWYVLEAAPDAHIIYGHTAQTKVEMKQLIEQNQWDDLLLQQPIKAGDFFYVPSGTIHALGKGALILEVQQSSDTTYRLYDYDRLDDEGHTRELHVTEALDVTTIPFVAPDILQKTLTYDTYTVQQLIQCNFFTVELVDICTDTVFERRASYTLVQVISGVGTIDGYEVQKGSACIIPATVEQVHITGTISFICSYKA